MLKVTALFNAMILFTVSGSAWAAPERAVPHQYVIELKPSAMSVDFNTLERALGAKILRRIPNSSIVVVAKVNETSPKKELQSLQASSLVKVVEPNFIVTAQRMPNDPEFEKLWGMRNVGQRDSSKNAGVPGVDIGVEQAWDIETGSRNVVVAVVDTGIDHTHADLKANLWVNETELHGEKGVDDDRNGYVDDIHGYDFMNNDGDPMDDNGHGSHVAGIIGAGGNDGAGIVGVNWNVRMMALKFLDEKGEGTMGSALEAIKYAIQMKTPVMNNSWGGVSYSKIMHDLIKEADSKQILFVAAAGNHSKNNDEKPYYPANYESPNVIAVSAVDNLGKLANFSGYGAKTIHLAAPGVNVISSTPKGYQSFSGTSMATPHVSGVAALVLAREPNLAPQDLRARLIRTAAPVRRIQGKVIANGMVNAYYALLDQPAPKDLNDPNNWTLWNPLSISTAHPYENEIHQRWVVEVPGAQAIAVYFSQFNTEAKFDQVSFYDRRGMFIADISGPLGPHWSPVIPGDYVRIVFHSDFRNNAEGFEITKVGYR